MKNAPKAADRFLAGKQVASLFAIAFNLLNLGVLATMHTNLFPPLLNGFGLPVLCF